MATKHIRALRPITIPGVRALLRGELYEVPRKYDRQFVRLVGQGHAEYANAPESPAAAPRASAAKLEPPIVPSPVVAVGEPSKSSDDGKSDEDAELAELEAELARLEGAKPLDTPTEQPKRPLAMCEHCGKSYKEHTKKPTAEKPPEVCEGLRRLFKPVAVVT